MHVIVLGSFEKPEAKLAKKSVNTSQDNSYRISWLCQVLWWLPNVVVLFHFDTTLYGMGDK